LYNRAVCLLSEVVKSTRYWSHLPPIWQAGRACPEVEYDVFTVPSGPKNAEEFNPEIFPAIRNRNARPVPFGREAFHQTVLKSEGPPVSKTGDIIEPDRIWAERANRQASGLNFWV
jgi:hypothetical protein